MGQNLANKGEKDDNVVTWEELPSLSNDYHMRQKLFHFYTLLFQHLRLYSFILSSMELYVSRLHGDDKAIYFPLNNTCLS